MPDVITDKTTLNETSPLSPALASFAGRLFIGWKGDGNDNLNLMHSIDYGRTFGDKLTSPETSPSPPALCPHRELIAWTGNTNKQLNLAHVHLSGAKIDGFTQKATLGDTSPMSPSIACLQDRIFIVWKGDGNNNLNVMYSTDDGATFTGKYTSPETSSHAPSICVHCCDVFIAWKGDGNDNLNVARVELSGDGKIVGLVDKVTLKDTSPVGPSIASVAKRLFIGWKGDGNDFLNVMYSADDGRTFGDKRTSGETSSAAPSLAEHRRKLHIAWKGKGNDFLNVGVVAAYWKDCAPKQRAR